MSTTMPVRYGHRLLLLLTAILGAQITMAQTNVNVIVSFKDNIAMKQIKVDTSGVIAIDTLDGFLRLDLPDTSASWSQYSLQFNNDNNKFTVAFDCKNDKACVAFPDPADVMGRQLFLSFQNGTLTYIGSKSGEGGKNFNPGKPVPKAHPYVKIIRTKPAAQKSTSAKLHDLQTDPNDSNQRVLAIGDTSIDQYRFDCPDTCVNCRPFKIPPVKGKNCCDPQVIKSLADYVFRTPCLDSNGKAVSVDYVLLYDTRPNSPIPTPLFLKLSQSKHGFEYFQVIKSEDFHPHAGQEIGIAIIRPKDTLYTANSIGVDNFLSQASGFANLTTATAASGTSTASTTDETVKTSAINTKTAGETLAAGAPTPSSVQKVLQASAGKDSTLALLQAVDTASLSNKAIILNYIKTQRPPIDNLPITPISEKTVALLQKKGNEASLKEIADMVNKSSQSLKNAYLSNKAGDTIAKNKPHVDSGQIYRDSAINLAKKLNKRLDQIIFKAKLLGLDASLARFNQTYDTTIDLKEWEYQKALSCLRSKIDSILKIPAPSTDSMLSVYLTQKALTIVDSIYFKDFADRISDIRSEYAKAIKKKSTVGLFYTQSIKVPKADSLDITIKKVSGLGTPYQRSFAVSGGWKIDFSTGVFVNGIKDVTFSLGQHTFRYKATADTILPNGTDSIRYGGTTKDTTGNLIHSNSSKLSYTIGVLAHFYRRSAKDINWGGVTGVMLDNNSKLLFVGGGSIMIRAGKNRLALAAGAVVGQENQLTSINSQYTYNAKTEPDYQLYNSIYQVPRFYTGTNEITTVTTWKISWFAGITYNITIN
jgi:hypothetical protein